jgi:uncharacterized protein Yka (UPF0111/DUF47 family)
MKKFSEFLTEDNSNLVKKVDKLTQSIHDANNKLSVIGKDAKDKKLKRELDFLSKEINKILTQYDNVVDRIESGNYEE